MEKKQENHTTDRVTPNIHPCCSGAGFYEISVKGHLSDDWSDWLEGLEVKLLANGEMILSGTVVDQAALMGILNKLNRLNLALLTISRVDQKE